MTDSELLQAIYNDTQELKQKVSTIENRVSNTERDITDIKLTLESEISVNIKRVAEGHLDLSRNLISAIKTNNEFEMLAVRVNVLESDVRRLKEKIS